jgi:S-formylglutathione hydrolase FrmB
MEAPILNRNFRCLAASLLGLFAASLAFAGPIRVPQPWELKRFNKTLHGQVLDFTHNHGKDLRFESAALGKKRDMYVYLPPGYDGVKKFPVLVWLHGFSQDEKDTKSLAKKFDEAVASCRIPPMVIACPDGTFNGRPSANNSGSFYLNGVKGNYEDYLIDVWNFLQCNFSIRPEREAHVLAGASMGGTSAFNLGFKYREIFGVIVGVMPLLNLRYADCHGDRKVPFDPCCIGWIEKYRPMTMAGRLLLVVPVRYGKAMRPVFGNRGQVQERLPSENPVEMLDLYDIKPDEFKMFIAYGARDQFNGDDMAKSFLHFAGQRGVTADVSEHPTGRHNRRTGYSFFDSLAEWLTPVLSPYVPQ